MTSQQPTLPKGNQRSLVVGRTGSGKTVFGLYMLSQMDFDLKPWIIIDFKGDEHIGQINASPITWHTEVGGLLPGLYILRLDISQQTELETFLENVYRTGNTGLFVDEGYMIGEGYRHSKAFRAILTQGRSKNIGVILNSQRPVWLDMFTKSEANKIVMFHLNADKDRKTMAEFMPDDLGIDAYQRLDNFHSIYYDIDANVATTLGPSPPPLESVSLMNRRLSQMYDARNVAPPVNNQSDWRLI